MSDRDPYAVLGVERSASQDAIQKAYRKLAKKYHPDLNPEDDDAERRFKEAASAHAILGDAKKRAQFDRGEIDASGADKPPQATRPRYDGADFKAQEGFANEAEMQAFLNEMFRAGRGGRAQSRPTRGADIYLTIGIPFLQACKGGKRRIQIPNRPPFDIQIPAGLEDGEIVPAPGRGEPGYDGAPSGDAFVEVHIEPHRHFQRKDTDILLDLPISFAEAVLGARVRAPTVHGQVDLKVPANATAGSRLRLRGKGVADGRGGFGDQYVRLIVTTPKTPDADLTACLASWAERCKENPRVEMEKSS